MNVTITKCDVCGKVKGAYSAWFKADVDYGEDCTGVQTAVRIELGGLLSNAHNTDICDEVCLKAVINQVTNYIRSGHSSESANEESANEPLRPL